MRLCRRIGALVLAASLLALSVASASAADQIYWANEGGDSISRANTSGGGGADIPITGVTVDHPQGLAVDSAAGRLYWANRDELNYSIRFANLDGSGGGILNTGAAPVVEPDGLAIYPAAGRIYWGNFAEHAIYFANLDGSGGGELNTTGALVEQPLGIAVYPDQNRIYWADFDQNRVDFANLDGSGGGSLDLTGGKLDMPRAVAVNASANRVYWPNTRDSGIGSASAIGGEGGSVFTDGLPLDGPNGIAIDPAAKRVYWGAPVANSIAFASLTEGGSLGLLDTTGATLDNPAWPILLQVPRNIATPTITKFASPVPRVLRKPKPGQPMVPLVASQTATLNCSQGSWAGDLLESFLYRAPQRISYQWLRNERPIAGATTSSLVASEVGDYVCRATASNGAGSSAKESDPVNVTASFKLGRAVIDAKKGIAKLPVATSGSGVVALSGKGVKPRKLKSKAGSTSQLSGVLVLKPRGRTKARLESDGRARVTLKIAFTPTGGTPLSRTKSFSLHLAD